jgi:hypothetical protein
MRMKKKWNMSDQDLAALAIYELGLEACGGNKELYHSLEGEDSPKIFEGDAYKRWKELMEMKKNGTLKEHFDKLMGDRKA